MDDLDAMERFLRRVIFYCGCGVVVVGIGMIAVALGLVSVDTGIPFSLGLALLGIGAGVSWSIITHNKETDDGD